MKLLLSGILIFCLMPSNALAEETVNPVLLCEEAKTVFQDVSAFGRKDRAAKNMTQMHERMARQGWRFADMEVLSENGDLEGFFLSYTRPVPCPINSEAED
jgi:hypothetical protein